jgi:hypothetical protein
VVSLLFSVVISDFCREVKYSDCLIREMKSPYGSWLLQSDIKNIRVLCIANYMKPNFNETRMLRFWLQTVWTFCHTRDYIGDLGVLTDTELHFHQQVDNIFSQVIRLLGLIRSVTSCWSPHGLQTLYCTLVRPKLQYTAAVWISVTCCDACKLQFVSLCLHRGSQLW